MPRAISLTLCLFALTALPGDARAGRGSLPIVERYAVVVRGWQLVERRGHPILLLRLEGELLAVHVQSCRNASIPVRAPDEVARQAAWEASLERMARRARRPAIHVQVASFGKQADLHLAGLAVAPPLVTPRAARRSDQATRLLLGRQRRLRALRAERD